MVQPHRSRLTDASVSIMVHETEGYSSVLGYVELRGSTTESGSATLVHMVEKSKNKV